MAVASVTQGAAAAAALRSVLTRVQQAAERSGRRADQVRVVAVSKTKPVPLIRHIYDTGHRCFGENCPRNRRKSPSVFDLMIDFVRVLLPEDIEWHFIGHLQSNKVKSLLAGVPNLYMVETVDDEKFCKCLHVRCCKPILKLSSRICEATANRLDRTVAGLGRKPLKVLVQVNTSGEESKSGIEPSGCVELAKHVKQACPNLVFSRLMTIGMLDYTSTPENFKTLANCRHKVCEALGMPGPWACLVTSSKRAYNFTAMHLNHMMSASWYCAMDCKRCWYRAIS